MASTSQPIQRLVYIQRNPSLTLEEFHHHWRNTHASLVKDWAKKYGVTGYMQVSGSK